MSLRTHGVEGRRDLTIADLKPLESGTKEGDSPVGEGEDRQFVPEYRGTREILWEAGGTTPQG